MLRGNPMGGDWRNDSVKKALDLCLSCKGCKGDCPVHVDVATYKAEFLSHYYEGRRRPLHAYVFGLIHQWARLGSVAPAIANAVMQAPGLSALAKAALNVAPAREMPPVANTSFRDWFRKRQPSSAGRQSA